LETEGKADKLRKLDLICKEVFQGKRTFRQLLITSHTIGVGVITKYWLRV